MSAVDGSLQAPTSQRPDGPALLDFFAHHPVVAILRAPDASAFRAASEVMYDAGIRCLEFTLTTVDALAAVADVVAALPSDVRVGVGTLRSVEDVDAAVDAGAHFLVSQVFKPELTAAATRRGVVYIPGALTPTEIVAAFDSGVPAVKVSPIGPVGGLDYLDQVRGPLPEVPLMPTGGVLPEEVPEYLARGAVAVGLSGPFLQDSLLPGGDMVSLARRATAAVESARRYGRHAR